MKEKGLPEYGEKLLGLEILRFLCSFLIIVCHFGYWDYGALAVNYFWVLSGTIFFWKYAEPIRNNSVRGHDFLILRLSRLYPLHLILLTLFVVLNLAFAGIGSHFRIFTLSGISASRQTLFYVLNSSMTSAWFADVPTFNTVEWSVSVEILMYVIFFGLCKKIRFGLVSVGLLAILAKAGEKIVEHHGAALRNMINVQQILLCGFFFFSGGFIHYLRQTMKGAANRIFGWLMVVAFCGLSLVSFEGLINIYLYFELVAPIIVGCFLIAPEFEFLRVVFLHEEIILMLGNLTYASYLIHLPFLRLSSYLLGEVPGGISSKLAFEPLRVHPDLVRLASFFLFVGAVYLLAYLSFNRIERPAQQFLRRRLIASSH